MKTLFLALRYYSKYGYAWRMSLALAQADVLLASKIDKNQGAKA